MKGFKEKKKQPKVLRKSSSAEDNASGVSEVIPSVEATENQVISGAKAKRPDRKKDGEKRGNKKAVEKTKNLHEAKASDDEPHKVYSIDELEKMKQEKKDRKEQRDQERTERKMKNKVVSTEARDLYFSQSRIPCLKLFTGKACLTNLPSRNGKVQLTKHCKI